MARRKGDTLREGFLSQEEHAASAGTFETVGSGSFGKDRTPSPDGGSPASPSAMRRGLRASVKSAIAGEAAEQLDDSDELSGASEVYWMGEVAPSVRARAKAKMGEDPFAEEDGRLPATDGSAAGPSGASACAEAADASAQASRSPRTGIQAKAAKRAGEGAEAASADSGNAMEAAKAGEGGKASLGGRAARHSAESAGRGSSALAEVQKTANWNASRAAAAQAAGAPATASCAGAGGEIAAGGSGAGPVAAGILAAIAAFVLVSLAISAIAGGLVGFWEDERSKASLEGLPPYITYGMVEAALECQEEYGHPAGCTIAQIIVESGQGEHMSQLAERDHNLFGIKWASSFASCPEVEGKSSWATREEVSGQTVVIMADFTVFASAEDCIAFRSRVLLANSRYSDNPLIRQAIEECNSDKMAEGLKDAGYATSGSYVDSLKTAMETYDLYRFDGMSLEGFRSGTANGSTIVQAAYSQLGVPYVWGGSTPGVGLDCSGLTQYCYAQAGIRISHNSEMQLAELTTIPLSQARPGDILYKPGHVAIFIGGNEYIHEPHTGAVCCIASGVDYFACALRHTN